MASKFAQVTVTSNEILTELRVRTFSFLNGKRLPASTAQVEASSVHMHSNLSFSTGIEDYKLAYLLSDGDPQVLVLSPIGFE